MKIQQLDLELQQRLPSPQGVALAIMEACRREDVSITEVARLVQTDPALSGRLLKRANAANTGVRPVLAIPDAVNRIGLQSVRQLALSFSLIDQHAKGNCSQFDYGVFWSHSLVMGLATRALANALHLGSPDELFTCGLLARIGNLALATAYPQEYSDLLRTGTRGNKLLVLEKEILHIDHISLMSALLKQWGIPEVLIETMEFHEDPARSEFAQGTRLWQLSQTFHLALRIADFAIAHNEQAGQRISELTEVSSRLGLNALELGVLVDNVTQEWMSWGRELKIRFESLPSFDQMVRDSVRPDLETDAQWLRVLVVEDEPISMMLLETCLRDDNHYTVKTATNGSEALALALEFMPHVVVTDWRMPVMDGIELCKTLRSSDWGQNIYVLMLTSADKDHELVQAFDAGVDDYLTKPINLRSLNARLKAAWRYVRLRDAWERDHVRLTAMAAELAVSNRRLQMAALSDPLTELANRRAGLQSLTQAWSSAARYGHSLSVISLDIDHFKNINDTHGHALGDEVLKEIGQCLRATARKEDTLCRWGGEEFLVISPNVTLEQATTAAQRLRKAIAGLEIALGGKTIKVTASLGLACWENKNSTQEQLLIDVDRAMYAAKAAGRNRLGIFRDGKIKLHTVKGT